MWGNLPLLGNRLEIETEPRLCLGENEKCWLLFLKGVPDILLLCFDPF